MKNLDIKNPLFLGDFSGFTSPKIREWMAKEFEVPLAEIEPYQVLAACLDDGSYDSAVWFLLRSRETGQLFENHGSHCSCYGYENQFTPEPTTMEYLKSDKFNISCFKGLVPTFVEFFKSL